MSGLFLSLIVGAVIGALLGRLGQCTSGACSLIANWRRGALYGAMLGLAFYFVSGGTISSNSYPEPKNVKLVTEGDFETEVIQAGQPVVVDFFAKWCGPCKLLSPRLDKLAGEFKGRVRFVSVNVDQSPALATKYNVQGIPMLLFVGKDGKVAQTSLGLLSEEELRAKLETLIKN